MNKFRTLLGEFASAQPFFPTRTNFGPREAVFRNIGATRKTGILVTQGTPSSAGSLGFGAALIKTSNLSCTERIGMHKLL